MKLTITLDDGPEVVIEKLPIGKYAELLASLQELPKKFDVFISVDKTQIMQVLPRLIGESLPDVINLLVIATPLPREKLTTLGLSEIIDLLVAVAEVNNYSKVFDQIKKVIPQSANAPARAGETPETR